jgi:hypothetical protein
MLLGPLKLAVRKGDSPANPTSTSSSPSQASSSNKLTITATRTTASSSTAPPHTTHPASSADKKTSNDLKPGPIAGIAIATAILGALLAAFLTYLYMERKNRRSRRSRTSDKVGFFNSQKGHQNGPKSHDSFSKSQQRMSVRTRENEPSVSAKQPVVDLDKILPQPADDGTVTQEVSAFFTIIDGHVQNFYHDKPMSEVGQMSERINKQYALPQGLSAQRDIDINQLLSNPKSRVHAIACLICAEMLDSIDPFGPREHSLLPQVVTSFLRSAPAPDVDSHGE